MGRTVIVIALATVGLLSLQPASATAVYSYDDGSGESSTGFPGSSVPTFWLNAFQAVAGGESIEMIRIAFGHNGNNDAPPNGTAITVNLWDDANNDGNPTDATVVASMAGTIQSSHTDTFIDFILPSPVEFAAGDWFFAGFQSTDFAGSRDTNSSAGNSWFSSFSSVAVDPNNLSSADFFGTTDSFGFPGNWLIRAVGEPTGAPLPAPGTALLLALGGLGMLAGRRRRVR